MQVYLRTNLFTPLENFIMDLVGNLVLKGLGQIKNARVENVATDPVTPTAGQIWYNTTDGVYRGFDGTVVTTFASGGNTESLLAEINAIETAAGLNSDGTLPSLAGTNYATASASLFAALVALDTQAKTNADAIAGLDGLTTDLDIEVNAIETAVGLDSDGEFVAYTGTNYINAATTIAGAIGLLDGAVDGVADAVALNTTAISGKVSKAGDTLTGNLAFGGTSTVTGLAAPTDASDAATKNYVDNIATNLSWKAPVVGVEADHTDYATALVTGDRIVNTTDDKIYTVTTGGADGTEAIFDAGVLLTDGQAFFDKTNETGYVFDGGALVQFTGAGQIAAGVGLVKTGNQIDVNMGAGIAQLPSDEVGVDVLAAGGLFLTINGTDASTDTAAQLSVLLDGASLARSGTGLKIAANGVTATEIAASVAGAGLAGGGGAALSVTAGDGIAVTGDAVTLDLTFADARYLNTAGDTLTGALITAADPTVALEVANKQYVDAVTAALEASTYVYTGGSANVTHVVTHGIGSQYVNVTVVDSADKVIIPDSITFDSATQLTIVFNSAITCKAVVTGKYVAA